MDNRECQNYKECDSYNVAITRVREDENVFYEVSVEPHGASTIEDEDVEVFKSYDMALEYYNDF